MDSILNECLAALNHCALFEPPARGVIEVRGNDRVQFLHNVLTNDIKSLSPGKGAYACLLNAQAKILADMNVLCFEDYFWLTQDISIKDKTLKLLGDLIIMDDVELRDRTNEFKAISVHGPMAGDLVAQAFECQMAFPPPSAGEDKGGGADLIYPPSLPSPIRRRTDPSEFWRTRGEGMSLLSHTPASISRFPFTVVRINLIGVPGFEIIAPRETPNFCDVTKIGSEVAPIHETAVEILRVMAGVPKYGADFDESVNPLEARLEHAVSFTKGCFPGQEILARLDSRGGVSKKLAGIELKGERVPVKNDLITKGGAEAGRITSAVYSPILKRTIALGYLKKECWNPGCEVVVHTQDEQIPARAAALPFFSPV